MANQGYFTGRITKYPSTHVQSRSYATLMHHLDKVCHSLSKAIGMKQKRHLWNQRKHTVFKEVAFFPVG